SLSLAGGAGLRWPALGEDAAGGPDRVERVGLADRAALAPQAPHLEHPLALAGEEAREAGAEGAAAFNRERPSTRRVFSRELQSARVASAVRGHTRLEDDPASPNLDDGERVPVAVRVDPDHVVQLICKHPTHLQPRLGDTLRC